MKCSVPLVSGTQLDCWNLNEWIIARKMKSSSYWFCCQTTKVDYVISFFWTKCFVLKYWETCEHAKSESSRAFKYRCLDELACALCYYSIDSSQIWLDIGTKGATETYHKTFSFQTILTYERAAAYLILIVKYWLSVLRNNRVLLHSATRLNYLEKTIYIIRYSLYNFIHESM